MPHDSRVDMSRRKTALIWVLANVLAAVVFVGVASFTWIEPELADVPGANGGAAFVWFMSAVPIVVLSLVLNVGAVAWALAYRRQNAEWPATAFAWVSALVWVAALLLDNSRHGA